MNSGESNHDFPGKFVAEVLPWLVGAAGFLVFLSTLNHWVSLLSLGVVARTSGWLWQAEVYHPVTTLFLVPFRFVPAGWRPVCLNVFTAACAGLVLVLLARTVAIWRHDLAWQRFRHGMKPALFARSAKPIPVLLASVVLGLQFFFWEHATSATGEMIDLLLFAYPVRCLVEYRRDEREWWLFKAALVWGAGMTNNWGMIGFLPAFVGAVGALKGLSFLQRRFLLLMSASGLAGLSLYLLLPLTHALNPDSGVSFWAALKANWSMQKNLLLGFPRSAFLTLAFTILIPLLIISVRRRWHKTHAGDDSVAGRQIITGVSNLVHLGFLVLMVWIAFDPSFGPGQLAKGTFPGSYYFIAAIVAGYSAGHVLLLRAFRSRPAAGRVATYAMWTVVVGVGLALAWRNTAEIRRVNGPALRQLSRAQYESIRGRRAVVLSDDPAQLLLLAAEAGSKSDAKPLLLLDTRSLPWPAYHRFLARSFPDWPIEPPGRANREVLLPAALMMAVPRMAGTNPVFYLHPSFGYYFEVYSAKLDGALQELVLRSSPAPGSTGFARFDVSGANRFWESRWGALRPIALQARAPEASSLPGASRANRRFRLANQRNPTASYLAAVYSKALNDLGVRMQRQGSVQEARIWFERALELKPNNACARVNLAANRRRDSNIHAAPSRGEIQRQIQEILATYRTWDGALSENGPLDDEDMLYQSAQLFLAGGSFHQAYESFSRCVELRPASVEFQLGLAQAAIALGEFREGRERVQKLEVDLGSRAEAAPGALLCKFAATRGLGRTNEAQLVIEDYLRRFPENREVELQGAFLYMMAGQFDEASQVLARLVAREPANVELLASLAVARMESGRHEDAIQTLTRALELSPTNYVARLNRAVARLRAGQLDFAKEDYLKLESTAPASIPVLFGLGEIAHRQAQTNAAIGYYRRYLSNSPTASAEAGYVRERLEQLGAKPQPLSPARAR